MTAIPVQFVYKTGLKRRIFANVRLAGNWEDTGELSAKWSVIPMTDFVAEDGCPAFKVTVNFDSLHLDTTYLWGVLVDTPGAKDIWGIPTEVKDHRSTDRHRTFILDAGTGQQCYYLTHCRRLGAQKYYKSPTDKPQIRFAVWAPNASNVQVVMSTTWHVDDRERTPLVRKSTCINRIAGGYVDDRPEQPELTRFSMTRSEDCVWVTDIEDSALSSFSDFDHRSYMYRITRDDGSVRYRTDIYSRCQIGAGTFNPNGNIYNGRIVDLDGSVSCSVVVDPDQVTQEFDEQMEPPGCSIWPETKWVSEKDFWKDEYLKDDEGNQRRPPSKVEDLVIYELHTGALGFDHDRPGTIRDAMELLDHLQDLGVNAVELLPLAEFGGGAANWGYATSHYFAIEYEGGGRDKYKFFVRECHRRGIAVIMDVVYNHYVHNAERAQWMYDTAAHDKNVYYWYEGHPDDYVKFNNDAPQQRGHGGYLDNVSTAYAPRYHDEFVRKMFVSMAVAMVEEFHVDGFRVDQTTSIHAYNVRHADGHAVPNANVFGAKMIREWCRTLKLIKPDVMLMAEDHSEWDMVTADAEVGGLGFDAAWYANFYHHLIGDTDKGSDYAKLIKTAGLGDDRPLAMDYFAGALATSGQKRVVYNESHDEAGNGKFTHRTIVIAVNGAPLVGETRRYAEARCRLAFGMAILCAGTPMFLFGEEVGAANDFKYNEVLQNREDLHVLRNTTGKRMFAFYRDLIRLRVDNPALRSRNIDILHFHNDNRVVAFRRWNENQQFYIVGSLNNHPFSSGYVVRNARLSDGQWKEIFNSDASKYWGNNVGNESGVQFIKNGAIDTVVPANGFVVFQKID